MSISDRQCPKCGDVGSLPHHIACPICGAGLVAKGTLRAMGEGILHGAAIGFGVGLGVEAAHGVADAIGDGLSDLLG